MALKNLISLVGKEEAIRIIVKKLGYDGGPGSGNFGHKGRPGKVGGSGEGDGNENGGNSEYKKKLQSQRAEILSKDQSHQALFADHSGIADRETCIAAMRSGTASDLVNQYFDIMEANGDPTPTKPLRKFPNMYEEIKKPTGTPGNDVWTGTRIRLIREWTGMSEEEAQKAYKELDTFFGGSWSHADTRVIDEYIDRDGTYDGEIYRGIKFNQDEYDEFMKNLEKGSTIRMKGMNSSWSNDEEDAIRFSKSEKPVVLKCVKNKTSAPVDHLSGQGEGEVLAHSKAQWTVLNIEDLGRRTIITVVESEHRMSDENRAELREKHGIRALDAAPDREKRLVEQQKYLEVVPPDEELKKKLYGATANDGGPGSGNFNHAGRPGEVGGSAPEGNAEGENRTKSNTESPIMQAYFKRTAERYLKLYKAKKAYTVKPKAFKVDTETKATESGKKYADELMKEYKSLPESTSRGEETKYRFMNRFYPEEWYKLTADGKITQEELLKRISDVYAENGAPTLPEGKRRVSVSEYGWNKTSDADRIKELTDMGYSEEEAKKVDAALLSYTEGDWSKVDKSILEDYIKRSPIVPEHALYRGVNLNDEEMDNLFETLKNGVITMGRVTSWSSSKNTALMFSDWKYQKENKKSFTGEWHSVVFQIAEGSCRHGANLSHFSKFGEDEVITPSDATYSVLSCLTVEGVEATKGDYGNEIGTVTYVSLIERGAEYDK